MSLDSVASNTHGNLDEQISQLMQCKPLSEQEVTPFFSVKSFYFCAFLSFFFNFSGGFWEFSSFFFGEMVWIWLGLSGLKLGIYDKNLSFLFFEKFLDYFKGVFCYFGVLRLFLEKWCGSGWICEGQNWGFVDFFCFVCVV